MKLCKDCWKPRGHENLLISRCKECQYKKQSLKQTRVKQISQKRKTRIKENWEAPMFKEIWQEREHICYVCWNNIPEPLTFVFAHIAPKGTYPELRNIKENVALVCSMKCHGEVDKLFSWVQRQEHIRKLKTILITK